jgi:D-alanine-D-alanine ligase
MSDVVILFGGSSSERRVSSASAQNVTDLLPDAQPLFLAQSGPVYRVPREELLGFPRPYENDFAPRGNMAYGSLATAADSLADKVFLLALHGGEGEDGTVQGMLEARHIAYTGPGREASARAFDKEVAKQIAAGAGVRIAQSLHLSVDPKVMREELRAMIELHGRIVAKPVAGGSSVGLFHLRSVDDVEKTARGIEALGEVYLAEQFISGIELTVGVVDGDSATRALPPSEVRLEAGRAFDFEGKYLGKGTREITPAEVPPETTDAAQQLALDAHRALGCEGYSRTDMIVDAKGPCFLELNTLPGLTKQSFIPQQLAAEGTKVVDFLHGQIALARRRRDRQGQP